jgi:xylulokinase
MSIRPTEADAPVWPEEGGTGPAHTKPSVCALGIDVGSTNTKVVLIALAGDVPHELATASFPTPDDPRALLAGVDRAIRTVLETAPSRPVAVGVASMAETGVPLDENGLPIGALLRWNAAAGSSRPSELVERLGAGTLFAATGVPPLPKTPLLTLERLRVDSPDRMATLSRWAGVADLLTLALTGELVTDHTLAGRTLAYRLPAAGEALGEAFDADLLAEVGLRPEQFPRVAAPGAPAGAVTRDGSTRTGLPVGIPVFVAGHDHAVGAWGADVRTAGKRVDSLGTSEALLRVAGRPLDRTEAFAAGMSVTRTVGGDRETLLAGSPAGGSLIAALLRGDFSGGTPLPADDLFRATLTGAPSAMVLPYPLGRQTPSPDRDARLRFVDADGRGVDPLALTPEALAAAVLEGLCLQLRWMHEEQERITGEPATGRLRMIGGAASSNVAWATLKTEVLAEPVEIVTSAEPVAASAALIAAVRAGAAHPGAALARRSAPVARELDPHIHAAALASFVAAATAHPVPNPRPLTSV